MTLLYFVTAFVAILGLSHAHMCLLSPMQRKGFGHIEKAGEPACIKTHECDISGKEIPNYIFR